MTTPPQSPAPSAPQAYGTPAGYPSPAAYAPAASAVRGNPFGLASAVVGAVLLLSLFLQMIVQVGAIGRGDVSMLGIIGVATNLIEGLLAVTAVVLGIIGLTRRGRPQALAGIGTGIGVAMLISTIVWGLLYPAVLSLS
ncbi:hypothetical protein E4V99_07155 [Microbacterium sp. dk485]|uniref:hypothetical protein n=1 Tax=Microbacterium sp. dk485 TaxID=2560021 RepID=UPI0010734E3F|nr:hypothetical protein [Microbacterium sp. dk485]TFV84813.1 hypothetical protein E4V99_07155 [Microbacterium sp. dk485]